MNKRERLIVSAAKLFYTQGLSSTSLADIAKNADIPIGNVYYYFKTKDELALETIRQRRSEMVSIYAKLDDIYPDPRERLMASVRYYSSLVDEYTRYGCPIGRIVVDEDISSDKAAQAAAAVLTDFVGWASQQFQQLGYGEDATTHAYMLIGGIQGATVIAKALGDSSILRAEIERRVAWIADLPNKKISLGKASFARLEA